MTALHAWASTLIAPPSIQGKPAEATTPSKRLRAARLLAIMALWSIPLSTALTNVFVAAFTVAILIAPETYRTFGAAWRQPWLRSTTALAVALTASLAYTEAPGPEAVDLLLKYHKLLLLPLAWIAFHRADDRIMLAHRGLFWICVGVAICSTTNFIGWTSIGPYWADDMPGCVAKNRITAGLIGAWTFYYGANAALNAPSSRWRWMYGAAATWVGINTLFMIGGRTGQIVLLLLLPVCAWQAFAARRRQKHVARAVAIACIALVCGVTGSLLVKSGDPGTTGPRARLSAITTEVSAYRDHNTTTSTGLRLEWYRKALAAIADRPFIGHGVGSVRAAFAPMTTGQTGASAIVTQNPHNEFLLIGIQLGLIGLGLFLCLLGQLMWAARRLQVFERNIVLAWVAIFSIGSLANSLLMDFTEGHMLTLLCGIVLAGSIPAPKPADALSTARPPG